MLLLGDVFFIFGSNLVVDMDDWDYTLMMDDLMSSNFLTYCTSDAIPGHILFCLRFVDLHSVA